MSHLALTSLALDEHSLRDVAHCENLAFPAVQALEGKCQALAETVSSGAAATHGKISNAGLNHPAGAAAYLALRELDDKGRREVPEHRLKVIGLSFTPRWPSWSA